MKLSRKELSSMISEEIENLSYKLKKVTASDALSHDHPSEVETVEGVFGGGANIVHQVDHLKDGGYPDKTQVGIERYKIAESSNKISRLALRKEIHEALHLDYDDLALDIGQHIVELFKPAFPKAELSFETYMDTLRGSENSFIVQVSIITVGSASGLGGPKGILRRFKKNVAGKAGVDLSDKEGVNNVANRVFKMSLHGNEPVRFAAGRRKGSDGEVFVNIRVDVQPEALEISGSGMGPMSDEDAPEDDRKGKEKDVMSSTDLVGKVFDGRPALKSKYKISKDAMNINDIEVEVVEYPRDKSAVGRKFKLGKLNDDHPLKANIRKTRG